MSTTHLDDYLTTKESPIGFELNSFFPDGDGELHTHAFFEIVYMVKGSASHLVIDIDGNKSQSILEKGSLILIPTGAAHRFFESKEEYLHRDVVIRESAFKEACDFLSPSLYDDIMNAQIPLQISVSADRIVQFEQKIKLINQILPSKKMQKGALVKSFLVSLLECFLSSDTEEYFNDLPAWFNEFLSHFNKISCIKGGLPEIVSFSNYDKKYLCYVFKKYTGVTMTEYLNSARLNYAADLLKSTNKTVSEIALESGFSSTSYFNVIFKKRFRVTPKQMRKARLYPSVWINQDNENGAN